MHALIVGNSSINHAALPAFQDARSGNATRSEVIICGDVLVHALRANISIDCLGLSLRDLDLLTVGAVNDILRSSYAMTVNMQCW